MAGREGIGSPVVGLAGPLTVLLHFSGKVIPVVGLAGPLLVESLSVSYEGKR